MPTYEYNCTKCERKFDIHQSFADDALEVCPLPALDQAKQNKKAANGEAGETEADPCGGVVRKVFSSVGISFKGSGFYRNDSRASSSSSGRGGSSNGTEGGSDSGTDGGSGSSADKADKAGSKTDKTESKGGSKSDSKSDSKPDSKSSSKPDSKKPSKSAVGA